MKIAVDRNHRTRQSCFFVLLIVVYYHAHTAADAARIGGTAANSVPAPRLSEASSGSQATSVRPILSELNPPNCLIVAGPGFGSEFNGKTDAHGIVHNTQSLSLTVNGAHFQRHSVVQFNGKALLTHYVFPTRLIATLHVNDVEKQFGGGGTETTATVTVRNSPIHRGAKALVSAPRTFHISHWAMGG